MIRWLHQEEGICEGIFKSYFFRNDDNGDELSIYVRSSSLLECAEKCVESFNDLTKSEINEICKGIISCAKDGGINEEFELPELDNDLDILDYCWFTSLYVNMSSKEDKIFYVVEGEGDWGDIIHFVVKDNQVIYVGVDFFDYMEAGE